MNRKKKLDVCILFAIIFVLLFSVYRVDRIVAYYEKENDDFTNLVTIKIELLRSSNVALDKNKVANMMTVAASRDLENLTVSILYNYFLICISFFMIFNLVLIYIILANRNQRESVQNSVSG